MNNKLLKVLNKIVTASQLTMLDEAFIAYVKKLAGNDIDMLAGELQKACSMGNAEYVSDLQKKMGAKDMMQLANKIAKGAAAYKANAASAWTPWDDEKADQATKEHYAREYKKTDFKRGQKTREFIDKTMTLVISVENYLYEVDDCPEDKDYVKVGKNATKTMIEEAKVIRKLQNELSALNRLYENQLIGKK
jgi:hypothetical protein